MKLIEAIEKADAIYTCVWMQAGASAFELAVSKEDAMEACSEFLEHEFDQADEAIYNKEGRAIAYVNLDERSADSSFTLEIGSC